MTLLKTLLAWTAFVLLLLTSPWWIVVILEFGFSLKKKVTRYFKPALVVLVLLALVACATFLFAQIV